MLTFVFAESVVEGSSPKRPVTVALKDAVVSAVRVAAAIPLLSVVACAVIVAKVPGVTEKVTSLPTRGVLLPASLTVTSIVLSLTPFAISEVGSAFIESATP